MSTIAVVTGVIIILIVLVCLNYYIGRKILLCLKYPYPRVNGTIYTVIYILISSTMILGMLPLPDAINGTISWIGSYWMGIFVYLLLFLFLADLTIGVGRILKLIPRPVPRMTRFYASFAAAVLTVGTVSYGIYNATQIKTVSYNVQLNKTIDDMNIVLISDLHLGAVNSEQRLETIVTKINELKPDLVCIAGDIFNDDYNDIHDPDRAIDLLRSINATYGVYGSLGNHDGGNTFDRMIDFLDRSEIKLLNDEYVIIDERLALFGRIDPSPIGGFGELKRGDVSDTIAALDSNLPIVVMDHTPSNLDQYGDTVDLILSGHTHKGQLFPGSLITNAIFEVDYGHYKRNETSPHVIVSSGAGTWGMPMRVGTHNEVVSINLYG